MMFSYTFYVNVILKLLLHSVASPFSPLSACSLGVEKKIKKSFRRKSDRKKKKVMNAKHVPHTPTTEESPSLSSSMLIHMHQEAVKAVITVCRLCRVSTDFSFWTTETTTLTYLPRRGLGWVFFPHF